MTTLAYANYPKNVEKSLEELEKAWFKQRAFPDGWIDTMDDVRSAILIP
jgi:hypothetical protein